MSICLYNLLKFLHSFDFTLHHFNVLIQLVHKFLLFTHLSTHCHHLLYFVLVHFCLGNLTCDLQTLLFHFFLLLNKLFVLILYLLPQKGNFLRNFSNFSIFFPQVVIKLLPICMYFLICLITFFINCKGNLI